MPRYFNTPYQYRTQANLVAALEAAEHGIPVFPFHLVKRNGGWQKVPCITGWTAAATTDKAQIRFWWRQFPDAMPGIPTGDASGFDVADFDVKKGKDGVAELALSGYEPADLSPVIVQTASGGFHDYFRADGVASRTDTFGPGIDTRGRGGYVVAPGTVMPNGRAYGFINGGWAELKAKTGLPTMPGYLRPRTRPVEPGEGEPTGLPFHVVQSALQALPNDGDEFASRDDWLRIGMALHAETEGGEDGRAAWHEWSAQWSGYDETATNAAWESFTAGRGVTGWTVIVEAGRRGWSDPAVDELRQMMRREDAERDFGEADVAPEESDPISDMAGEPVEPEGPFFLDMAELLADPAPPREWHVTDWIPAKTVHMLGGDGGTGKSRLAIQLAVATGIGGEWLGHQIGKPGVAIYYGAEDDRDELHRRFADVCRASDIDPAEHTGRVFLRSAVAEDSVFATVGKDGKVKATALLRRIEKEIAALSPSLVVLDTLANLHALDANAQEQAKAFIGLLIGIGQRHGCTFVLLAHPSRTGLATGDGDGFSVGWNNAVRSRSYLAEDKDNPEIMTLTQKKSNYGRRGLEMKLEWHGGVFVKVNDERADAQRAKFVFLEILDRLGRQHQFYSNTIGPNYAPARFAEEPEAEAAGLSKAQLTKAMKRMLMDGVLKVEEYTKADRKPGKRLARGDYNLTPAEDFSDDDV